MVKIIINFDRNRNIIEQNSNQTWGSETFDLNDLTYTEVLKLNNAVNNENADILGYVDTEDKLLIRFREHYLNYDDDENFLKPIAVRWDGKDVYTATCLSVGEYILERFDAYILRSIEELPDAYKKLYKIVE